MRYSGFIHVLPRLRASFRLFAYFLQNFVFHLYF